VRPVGLEASAGTALDSRADSGRQSIFQSRVAYWPSRTGIFWWEDFRREEVARDFDLAAELGLTCLVISLVWQDFQPEVGRISLPAMRSLERVLDLAADRAICLVPTLFPLRLLSVVSVPEWTLELQGEPGKR